MTEYDEKGFFARRPLEPEHWRDVVPDLPVGFILNKGAVPPGMLLYRNLVTPATCDAIVGECEEKEGVRHTIADPADISKKLKSSMRTSEFIDLRQLKFDVAELVRQTFIHVVARHFKAEIEWFEFPEILRYRQGEEYFPHADAENWFPQERVWRRQADRDLSILIYLNDEFEGGEIEFPNFGVNLKPERGLMIAFPSDHRFLHAARPVKSGVRYTLVSWAAIKGGPRVEQRPPAHAFRV